MQDSRIKNNYFTQPDRRPPKSPDNGEIDEILAEAELPLTSIANICSARIRLQTNSQHVFDYWKLNWFPYSGSDFDASIYQVKGVSGYEPHIFYDLRNKRVLIVNSEYYGAAKSAGALGISEHVLKDAGPIHGACVAVEKENRIDGVVMIAPTGTGKTTQFHKLLYHFPNTKVHSDDYVFVFFSDEPVARATENWLYLRTEMAESHPSFIELFHDVPLENVVTRKEDCKQMPDENGVTGDCYREVSEGKRKCVFDMGHDRCYWSYANSRAMFPRDKFPTLTNGKEIQKGEKNVVNEATVKHVFLLTRDGESLPIEELDCDSAIKILKEGKFIIRPGAGPKEKWGQFGFEPFLNPYPPEMDLEKNERFFRKLHSYGVSFYRLNTGSYNGKDITIEDTHQLIRGVVGI